MKRDQFCLQFSQWSQGVWFIWFGLYFLAYLSKEVKRWIDKNTVLLQFSVIFTFTRQMQKLFTCLALKLLKVNFMEIIKLNAN